MAVDRPYGGFYDFYSVSPEYFGYTLVYYICKCLIPICYTIHFEAVVVTECCEVKSHQQRLEDMDGVRSRNVGKMFPS
jgi:hypothetical protein